MTTFAENFVGEMHNKPAPTGQNELEDADDTIYLGGIENIAENCNLDQYDDEDQFLAGDTMNEGTGTYYFKDGSKAGLRNQDGKWDAWVMRSKAHPNAIP